MSNTWVATPLGGANAPAEGSHWWALGLPLAERLPTPGRIAPDDPGSTRAQARLHDWYRAHDLGASGQFDARLADLALTEDDLLTLLAEAPPALAERVGSPPAWARFTAQVIAAAYEPSGGQPGRETGESDRDGESPTAGNDAWTAGFAQILRPYLDVSVDRLTRRSSEITAGTTDGFDIVAIGAEFRQTLSSRLVRVAARTLVRELNTARSRGQLAGSSPEERFLDFIRQFRQPATLHAFLAWYPVLARLLAQTCEYAIDAAVELLRRFCVDRAAIVATFFAGRDPGRLVALHLGAGDRHQRGRTVALLRFTTGVRLVYKPRPLTVHRHFNEVLRWLDGHHPGLAPRALTVLDRTDYGWTEFTSPQPCADRSEVERFYRRQGALLAVLYALDGSDVHYENLIACGDQPVLVDVETLFHPSLHASTGFASDPAATALTGSVYRSALLPQLLLGDEHALDISGLGGDRDAPLPTPVVDWHAPGTDEMRLVRRGGRFAGADNRPRLDGVDVDPTEFTEQLLAGFRDGYDVIVRNRHDLIDPDGLLHRFVDDEVRVVARATRVYVRLLDESTHPDVLRDALDRDRLLDVLWAGSAGDPARLRLVRSELAELWHGDVPIFTARPGHRHLWAGTGDEITDVLDASPLDQVIAKIRSMGDVDRYDQEWIIRTSLATRRPHSGHETGSPVPRPFAATTPDPGRLLAAARGVADQIIARGYTDDSRINWLGLELLDDRQWMVMPLGAGLASGYSGVALFLAQLAALTGDKRYASVARRALSPLPHLIEYFTETPELARAVGSGGFAGFGGIAYALAQVSVLLDDRHLADLVEPTVRLAAELVTTDQEYGVHDGLAGCLAAMLAVHQYAGLESAKNTAAHCANRLLARQRPQDDPAASRAVTPAASGFASGLAGIAWALLRFARVTGDVRAAERGREDFRAAVGPDQLDGHSWCQGQPGMGLALIDATGPTGEPWTGPTGEPWAVQADEPWADRFVERTIEAVVTSGPLPNHSLCHGELGRLELLCVAARNGRVARTAHLRHASMLLSAIEQSGPRCGTPENALTPGLLNGMAGIGHGLLRLGFPDQIPSALLLQPPDQQPRMP